MATFDGGKRRAAKSFDKFILTFVLALQFVDARFHKKVRVKKLVQKEEKFQNPKKEATKPKALFEFKVALSTNDLHIRNQRVLFYFIYHFWFFKKEIKKKF